MRLNYLIGQMATQHASKHINLIGVCDLCLVRENGDPVTGPIATGKILEYKNLANHLAARET